MPRQVSRFHFCIVQFNDSIMKFHHCSLRFFGWVSVLKGIDFGKSDQ